MTESISNSRSNPTINPTANKLVVSAVLVSRTLLLLLAYFITASLFSKTDASTADTYARAWWPVSLIVINLVVLGVLAVLTKREGKTLGSLIGFERARFKKDALSSLWMIGVSMVLAFGATMGFGGLLYQFKTPSELMSLSTLPLWAVILALGVHPIINGFVEEMTYNGYVFQRLEGWVKSSWLTVTLVTFFFTLQHIAIPFAADVKFLFWRFLSFVPLLLFWVLIYLKKRRLTSLIIVHWFMDIFAVLSILFIPMS